MQTKVDYKNGFTLIELLLVLTILSIIILMSITIPLKYVKNQQTKHFLALLQSDILFVQNQSYASKNTASIIFRENNYILLRNYNENALVREYPRHISFNNYETNMITFNSLGNNNEPGSIRFKINGKNHKLIFPLGKGRGYVE